MSPAPHWFVPHAAWAEICCLRAQVNWLRHKEAAALQHPCDPGRVVAVVNRALAEASRSIAGELGGGDEANGSALEDLETARSEVSRLERERRDLSDEVARLGGERNAALESERVAIDELQARIEKEEIARAETTGLGADAVALKEVTRELRKMKEKFQKSEEKLQRAEDRGAVLKRELREAMARTADAEREAERELARFNQKMVVVNADLDRVLQEVEAERAATVAHADICRRQERANAVLAEYLARARTLKEMMLGKEGALSQCISAVQQAKAGTDSAAGVAVLEEQERRLVDIRRRTVQSTSRTNGIVEQSVVMTTLCEAVFSESSEMSRAMARLSGEGTASDSVGCALQEFRTLQACYDALTR